MGSPGSVEPKIMKAMPPTRIATRMRQPHPVMREVALRRVAREGQG